MESPSNIDIRVCEALCSLCNNVKHLQACFHCMLPLCSDCVACHLESWRESSVKYCETTTNDIEKYSKKISSFSPIIAQNKTNIENAKDKIQETFESFIQKLTKQKDDLFKQLDELQSDNENFLDFEKNILDLKGVLEQYHVELKSDKKDVQNLYEDFQQFKETVKNVSSNYSSLKNRPLKIVGEYDKPKLDELDQNLFGNLIVTESDLIKEDEHPKEHFIKNHKKMPSKVNDLRQTSEDFGKIQMFGTLRIKLKRFADQQNDLNLIEKKPMNETEILINPKFVASNAKNFFVCDQDGHLLVAEMKKNQFEKKSYVHLKMSNIKSMAVNKNYLAFSFSDLSQEKINWLKKFYDKFNSKNGVIFFKLPEFNYEKVISVSKNYCLTSPEGICLNDSYLFVCDKDSHMLLKIDIKKETLSQRLITDGQPVSVSVGDKYLVFIDSLKMELNLVDLDKLIVQKTIKLSQDLFNESFDLAYKEKSFLIVKNRDDMRCVVYDSKLNFKYSFDYENSDSQGLGLVQQNGNNCLILGRFRLKEKKYKIGFFIDF